MLGVSEIGEDRVMTILDSWIQLDEDEDHLDIQFDKLSIGDSCMRRASESFSSDYGVFLKPSRP